MIAHVYKFGRSDVWREETIETNRTTMLENGQEKFGVPGRVMAFGVANIVDGEINYEKLTVIPLIEIEWFWIEETK